ncbi:hypothetical protein TRIUR3_29624 [Triticum urartu]|uniref:Uncharacterized protein n=1 Tax=Triticum urartu TaxID=4572 RepID=M7YSK3_TRIUA|nr:hypothetical protein TRIUR3_29624 [Triticum urartu]
MEVVAEAGAQQPWDQFKEEVEIMEEQPKWREAADEGSAADGEGSGAAAEQATSMASSGSMTRPLCANREDLPDKWTDAE